MPANSVGMVVAPTYPMLRDATLRTFLELAEKGGILQNFSRSDMTATLIDGKRLLFRSGDDPDRLRGPNLGWFYLDEMAQMEKEVWLVMIGRLRETPGKAWGTTTPKGFNWVYETFVQGGGDYSVTKSSTRENPYLPPTFIQSLENSYTSAYLQQEVEGDFVEPEGALFKRQWFTIVEHAPEGLTWVRYWDLAASTKTTGDYTACAAVALADDGTLYVRDMIRGRWEWPDAKKIMISTMLAEPDVRHGIEKALHGLAAVQELQRERTVAHVTIRGIDVDRDKLSRALPWASRAEQGKVLLVRGPWIETFLGEVSSFTGDGKTHDDQVDTVSGAFKLLASKRTLSVVDY